MPKEETSPNVNVWLLYGLIVLAVFFGAGFMLLKGQQAKFQKQANIERLEAIIPTTRTVLENRREGNFVNALAEYEATRPLLQTADEQALAVHAAHKLRFFLTGDINTMLEDIRSLKKIAIDPSVDLWVRVNVLNTLQAGYCASGRDPLVFEEL